MRKSKFRKIVTIPVRVEVDASDDEHFNEAVDRLTDDDHPWTDLLSMSGGWFTIKTLPMGKRAAAQFKARHRRDR